jgi:RNA polymerase sigma-70 factor (sigma-E family)
MRVREGKVPFEDFVRARSSSLLRTAFLLTGQNQAEAEDLLQIALERAYRHWRRISGLEQPELYVRRVLVNASADRRRRLARRPELPLPAVPEGPVTSDPVAAVADRDFLLRALAKLPPRQRAVLVLRYFDDMSESQTAQMLGCSLSTVKTQSARGLARLREVTEQFSGRRPEPAGEVAADG